MVASLLQMEEEECCRSQGVLCQRRLVLGGIPSLALVLPLGGKRWRHQLVLLFWFTFFNTSLLQKYVHGAFEDMWHWYIQQCISHINMK